MEKSRTVWINVLSVVILGVAGVAIYCSNDNTVKEETTQLSNSLDLHTVDTILPARLYADILCEEKNLENLICESAEKAFYCIPNRRDLQPEDQLYMTRDMYVTLSAAEDVPGWWGEDMGDDDFMGFFVVHHHEEEFDKVDSVKLIRILDYRSEVMVTYRYKPYENSDYPAIKDSLMLTMNNESGSWLLDDFGSETYSYKLECKDYIIQQVNDYLSGESYKHLRENEIEKFNQDFKAFFACYREYLHALGIELP